MWYVPERKKQNANVGILDGAMKNVVVGRNRERTVLNANQSAAASHKRCGHAVGITSENEQPVDAQQPRRSAGNVAEPWRMKEGPRTPSHTRRRRRNTRTGPEKRYQKTTDRKAEPPRSRRKKGPRSRKKNQDPERKRLSPRTSCGGRTIYYLLSTIY